MLWWKWELDAERRRERECGFIRAAQHSRSLTDIDPSPNQSQFPSYVVTFNYVLLHLQSSVFQQRHPKTATVWWAHIYEAHTKNTPCSGTWGCAQWRSERVFMCTSHFSLSKCLKSLGWVCYSLCYNISIWGEDECVPFFTRHPSSLLSPTSWKLLSGW